MGKFGKTLGIITVLASLGLFLASCRGNAGGHAHHPGQKNVDLKAPPEGTEYNLTILHTNDLHSSARPFGRYHVGGLARHAWLNREIRMDNELRGANTLILNAGDTRDGTTFNDGTETAGMWGIMDMIGYDATEIGNHDHLFGANTLFNNLSAAFDGDVTTNEFGRAVALQNMKVLWGNVNPTRMNLCPSKFVSVPPIVKDSIENTFVDPIGDPCKAASYPDVIDPTKMGTPDDPSTFLFHQTAFYDYGDIRVGLFGVTTDEPIYTIVPGQPIQFGPYSVPSGVESEGAVFYPPDSTYINQIIDYLADPDGNPDTDDGADVIICLSHAGESADESIAENTEGPVSLRHVDVVVGGHSHTLLNTALEFDHDDGAKSWVVQADWGGIYLGRVDLNVQDGVVEMVNSALIPVDSKVPAVKEVNEAINHLYQMDGGINDWFKDAYRVLPTDLVGFSEIDLNYNNFLGETPLTNLVADAFYWKGHESSIFTIPDTNILEAGGPGFVDFAVMVPFVLHGEETLLKGQLTVENMLDTLHIHDLTTDPTRADTIHVIELAPLPPGGITFGLYHYDSQVELILEIIYGLVDLLPPEFAGLINEYLGTLQFKGITFVVDYSQLPFNRIDPASIFVNGEPPDLDRYYYMSLNSTIARFLGTLGALVGGIFGVDFMNWDMSWSETDVPEWVALMEYIEEALPSGTITPELVAVNGGGMRTLEPDLTLQPWDTTFTPSNPVPGDTVRIQSLILNTGMTTAPTSEVAYTFDPTPKKLDDDPDGFTDSITGFHVVNIGSELVHDVPAFTDRPGSVLTDGINWLIPADLPPGEYFICPIIKVLISDMPEILTGNNSGPGLCASLKIH